MLVSYTGMDYFVNIIFSESLSRQDNNCNLDGAYLFRVVLYTGEKSKERFFIV